MREKGGRPQVSPIDRSFENHAKGIIAATVFNSDTFPTLRGELGRSIPVIGRKNYLFCDTVAGANASANLYSLIETAKVNMLEPCAYLRTVSCQ